MHKPKIGPIGRGFVTEVKTTSGTRYVARWNAYTLAPDGSRKRVSCGPHELGSRISHGPGLKSLAEAKREWEKVYWTVFLKHHPELLRTDAITNPAGKLKASGQTKVKDFILPVWEPERTTGLEENSRTNWEYYRDAFLLPFCGEKTLAEMNDKSKVKAFMQETADREFSNWTAKKAFSCVKGLLDMSRDIGLTVGNESRLFQRPQRIPKGVKTAHSQPYTSGTDFVNILSKIERPRDQIILKILFLCAVRRSELFVFKWSDFDGSVLSVRRSFDSRTHKINEWNPDRKAHGKWLYRRPWLRTWRGGESMATPRARRMRLYFQRATVPASSQPIGRRMF